MLLQSTRVRCRLMWAKVASRKWAQDLSRCLFWAAFLKAVPKCPCCADERVAVRVVATRSWALPRFAACTRGMHVLSTARIGVLAMFFRLSVSSCALLDCGLADWGRIPARFCVFAHLENEGVRF